MLTSAFHRRLRIEMLEPRRLLAITVNTLTDEADGSISDGDISLRDAIALAAPGETIDFLPSLTSGGPVTINLTVGPTNSSRQLTINKNLAINGPGAGLFTIKAFDPTSTQKNGDGSRVFTINDGTATLQSVIISGLTLTGGDVSDKGGAIYSRENLTLASCVITGNSVRKLVVNPSALSGGGGVFSYGGGLTVIGGTISGNSARDVSNDSTIRAYGGGIFNLGGSLSITSSTISGNSADAQGGGVQNGDDLHAGGALALGSSTINGNSGGGVYHRAGTLSVSGSAITNNYSGNGLSIISAAGTATVTGSTISANSADFQSSNGGGIDARNCSLSISGSTISSNFSAQSGGVAMLGGSLSFANSTVSDNSAVVSAGGVGVTSSTLTVTDSTINGNMTGAAGLGGGIMAFAGSPSTITVTRSTISGNTAFGNGGGIAALSASLTVTESTLSGNSSFAQGGGIYWQSVTAATATITASTISGNSASRGGGLYNQAGTATIRFSTITNNTATDGTGSGVGSRGVAGTASQVYSTIIAGNLGHDVSWFGTVNTFQSTGYNLIGIGSGVANFNQAGDQTGVADPMLGALGQNGGPTWTHFPMSGSAAVDKGNPAAVPGAGGVPVNDQRGAPFGRLVDSDAVLGARIDIGAVERQSIAPELPGDYNRNNHVDAADYTVWRNNLGRTGLAPYAVADGNGDGSVTMADFHVWEEHFGQTLPEPGAGSGAAAAGEKSLPPASAETELSADSLQASSELQTIVDDRRFFVVSSHDAEPAISIMPLIVGPVHPGVVQQSRRSVIAPIDFRHGAHASWRDTALLAWFEAAAGRQHLQNRSDHAFEIESDMAADGFESTSDAFDALFGQTCFEDVRPSLT